MSDQITKEARDGSAGAFGRSQTVDIELKAGPVEVQFKLDVTPSGLLAIGAMVTGILMSSAAIVWAATSIERRHPIATRLKAR